MNLIAFILVVAAGVAGLIENFGSAWKSITGWALMALSAGILLDLCTHLSHTVHT